MSTLQIGDWELTLTCKIQVVLDRDLNLYIQHDIGPQTWLRDGITRVAITTMLKTDGKPENLRRAPGPQGEIKKVRGGHGSISYMTVEELEFSQKLYAIAIAYYKAHCITRTETENYLHSEK